MARTMACCSTACMHLQERGFRHEIFCARDVSWARRAKEIYWPGNTLFLSFWLGFISSPFCVINLSLFSNTSHSLILPHYSALVLPLTDAVDCGGQHLLHPAAIHAHHRLPVVVRLPRFQIPHREKPLLSHFRTGMNLYVPRATLTNLTFTTGSLQRSSISITNLHHQRPQHQHQPYRLPHNRPPPPTSQHPPLARPPPTRRPPRAAQTSRRSSGNLRPGRRGLVRGRNRANSARRTE